MPGPGRRSQRRRRCRRAGSCSLATEFDAMNRIQLVTRVFVLGRASCTSRPLLQCNLLMEPFAVIKNRRTESGRKSILWTRVGNRVWKNCRLFSSSGQKKIIPYNLSDIGEGITGDCRHFWSLRSDTYFFRAYYHQRWKCCNGLSRRETRSKPSIEFARYKATRPRLRSAVGTMARSQRCIIRSSEMSCSRNASTGLSSQPGWCYDGRWAR